MGRHAACCHIEHGGEGGSELNIGAARWCRADTRHVLAFRLSLVAAEPNWKIDFQDCRLTWAGSVCCRHGPRSHTLIVAIIATPYSFSRFVPRLRKSVLIELGAAAAYCEPNWPLSGTQLRAIAGSGTMLLESCVPSTAGSWSRQQQPALASCASAARSAAKRPVRYHRVRPGPWLASAARRVSSGSIRLTRGLREAGVPLAAQRRVPASGFPAGTDGRPLTSDSQRSRDSRASAGPPRLHRASANVDLDGCRWPAGVFGDWSRAELRASGKPKPCVDDDGCVASSRKHPGGRWPRLAALPPKGPIRRRHERWDDKIAFCVRAIALSVKSICRRQNCIKPQAK